MHPICANKNRSASIKSTNNNFFQKKHDYFNNLYNFVSLSKYT